MTCSDKKFNSIFLYTDTEQSCYYQQFCQMCVVCFKFWGFAVSLQDVLNNLGSSELDEDDLMLDLDLSDDQRHRHGNFFTS